MRKLSEEERAVAESWSYAVNTAVRTIVGGAPPFPDRRHHYGTITLEEWRRITGTPSLRIIR